MTICNDTAGAAREPSATRQSRSELAPRLFSNRSGPPEPSITYPRQMLRQLPAAWPFRDLAEQLGRSVALRGALGDEGFGATHSEGYIYSDSRGYSPVFVNHPAEPVYPDYLPGGAVQDGPGLRGLKG